MGNKKGGRQKGRSKDEKEGVKKTKKRREGDEKEWVKGA